MLICGVYFLIEVNYIFISLIIDEISREVFCPTLFTEVKKPTVLCDCVWYVRRTIDMRDFDVSEDTKSGYNFGITKKHTILSIFRRKLKRKIRIFNIFNIWQILYFFDVWWWDYDTSFYRKSELFECFSKKRTSYLWKLKCFNEGFKKTLQNAK